MSKGHFPVHVKTVIRAFPNAVKTSLNSPEISYVKLFKGMVNFEGNLSTKLEKIVGGGLGVFGKPNISNLHANTDFPIIEGEQTISKSYHDGFMGVSKVVSTKSGYLMNEAGTITKLKRDIEALAFSHAIEDNNILMGVANDKMLETAGIYGLGNHPYIGRVDSTLANDFENSTAEDIYNELKKQIHDFVRNVAPAGTSSRLPTRKITLILPTSVYLVVAMAEVNKGDKVVYIFDALKEDCASIGGLEILDNSTVEMIKHLEEGNETKCAILGYFDSHFIEARVPALVNFMGNQEECQVNKHTSYETLFASKNLGVAVKNIDITANGDFTKPLRVLQGL